MQLVVAHSWNAQGGEQEAPAEMSAVGERAASLLVQVLLMCARARPGGSFLTILGRCASHEGRSNK